MKTLLSKFVVVLLCLYSAGSFANEPLRLGASIEDPVLIDNDKNGLIEEGVIYSRIKDIFFKMDNLQFNLIAMPRKRAMYSLIAGKIDGIVGIEKKSKEKLILKYSKNYLRKNYKIYFSHEYFPQGITIKDNYELLIYRLGTLRGVSYSPFINEVITKGYIVTEPVNSIEQNIKKLMLGRIDIFICNEASMNHFVARLNLKGKIGSVHGFSFKTRSYLLSMSNFSPYKKILPLFNKIAEKTSD